MKKPRVNKKELAQRIAARAGVREQEAYKILNATIAEIQSAVIGGERVAFTDFGAFEGQKRAKRAARNPHTGEAQTVPARTVPVFRAAAKFRDSVIAANAPGQAPAQAAS